jgi:hypothetical protein
MRSVLFLGASLLAGTTAAAPQQPSDTAQQQRPIVVTGKPICQSMVPTGSILPQTVCKTAAQWEADRDASLVTIHEIARRREMEHNIHQLNQVTGGN